MATTTKRVDAALRRRDFRDMEIALQSVAANLALYRRSNCEISAYLKNAEDAANAAIAKAGGETP